MKKYFIIILIILISLSLFAEKEGNINVDIRFYEKKIYYLNQNDILIKISLKNDSTEAYRFKIATNRFFNIDFEVKTLSNLILDHSEKFIIERKSNQQVFFRELRLESEEDFGFIISLADFINIDKPGIYSVRCLFYSDLLVNAGSKSIASNTLTLHIRPPVIGEKMHEIIDVETGVQLERELLPPDEVVKYMINARQRSKWNKFLLYLDMESILLRNPIRAARFKKLSQEQRMEMIDEFKQELMQEKIEKEILVIPKTFEILTTNYTQQNGTVEVLEKFDYRDYIEVKRYTYYLEKKNGYWLIVDYTLENIGTE